LPRLPHRGKTFFRQPTSKAAPQATVQSDCFSGVFTFRTVKGQSGKKKRR